MMPRTAHPWALAVYLAGFLLVVHVGVGCFGFLVGPFHQAPQVREVFLASEHAGLASVVGFAFFCLAGLLGGAAVDRGRARVLITGAVVLAALGAGVLALGSGGRPAVILAGGVLMMFAGGVGYPVAVSVMSDAHPEHRRARALFVLDAGKGAGLALAPIAVTWIITDGPLPVFSGIAAGTLLLGGLLSLRLVRHLDASSDDVLPPRAGQTLWSLRSWLACLLAGLFMAALSAAFRPTSAMTALNLSPRETGYLLMIMGFSTALGTILGAVSGDLLMRRTARGHVWMLLPGLFLAPWCMLALSGWSLAAVRVAIIIYGLANGFFKANLYAAMLDVTPRARRGTAVAVFLVSGLFAQRLIQHAPDIPPLLFGLAGAGAGAVLVWAMTKWFVAGRRGPNE